jgi:chromosome segregation ATPase
MELRLKERSISGRSTNLFMNQITKTWVQEQEKKLIENYTQDSIKYWNELYSKYAQYINSKISTKSELENKEEIIKKQIEVIKELNEANSSLYNDIKELGEDLQSQDTGIKALIQDWKELREECAKQTKEVQRLNDKIKILSEMNDELQLENLRLKNKELDGLLEKAKRDLLSDIPYDPYPVYPVQPYYPYPYFIDPINPYKITCSNPTF